MVAWVDSEWGRVAVAGSGFLADGYDLYVIGGVEHVLSEEYACSHTDRADCVSVEDMKYLKSLTSSAALFGAILGQLIFGSLADRLGRRVIFIVTGSLIILGSVLSACVQEIGGPKGLMIQLIFCRGLLGFGIGGEYPLSASICAEGTAARRRGTLMALVFSNQGLGYLLSSLVMVILTFTEVSNAATWRIALGFGAVVPIVSLYFRMQMHESEAFEKVAHAREDGDQGVDMGLTVRRYAWHMLGTAGNWFIFDIVFYANGLFNADVMSIIDFGFEDPLQQSSVATLVIVLIMLPGYFVGVCFINKLGRKNVQIQGYINMMVWFGICGFMYETLRNKAPGAFLTIYGLTFFFSNFGPNLTTYVIPGEIYPSQAKATLHGISAASGKFGAFVGASLMPWVSGTPITDVGIQRVMFCCSGLAFAGLLLTIFLTPRYGPDDLTPKEKDETVGFVKLYFQRRMSQRKWAENAVKEDEVVSSSEAETTDQESAEDCATSSDERPVA